MKERPILFSGEMVKAILEGRKTQTRRIAKNITCDPYDGRWRIGTKYSGFIYDNDKRLKNAAASSKYAPYRCGDVLWVRETWSHTGNGVWTVSDARMSCFDGKVVYRADEDTPGSGWFPSIHMPKEFSRITLEVTDVRVERLQDITDGDAEAEGTVNGLHDFDCLNPYFPDPAGYCASGCGSKSYKQVFQRLWDSVNGSDPKKAWEANPWVWVIGFAVVKPEIKEKLA
jgi:hypothetical protein